jgi:hypothetical protein
VDADALLLTSAESRNLTREARLTVDADVFFRSFRLAFTGVGPL